MNKEKLKKKFIQGNKKAFDIIYNDYSTAMYRICLRYTNDSDTAADILQEAFIKIFEKRAQFNTTYELGGWIKRIVINQAINHYRATKKIQFVEDEHFFENTEDEEIYIEENEYDIKDMLLTILEELPEGYKCIFKMYVFDNLKHSEIAAYLNISVNTSKSQLSKARRMIRKKLDEKSITRSTLVNG